MSFSSTLDNKNSKKPIKYESTLHTQSVRLGVGGIDTSRLVVRLRTSLVCRVRLIQKFSLKLISDKGLYTHPKVF